MLTDTQRMPWQNFIHRQQKPGESTAEFADTVAELALFDFPPDAKDTMLMEQFVFGLVPQTRRDALIANPKTFAEAVILAQRVEGLDGPKGETQFQELVSVVTREFEQRALVASAMSSACTRVTAQPRKPNRYRRVR